MLPAASSAGSHPLRREAVLTDLTDIAEIEVSFDINCGSWRCPGRRGIPLGFLWVSANHHHIFVNLLSLLHWAARSGVVRPRFECVDLSLKIDLNEG